jgi:hypothetical protein
VNLKRGESQSLIEQAFTVQNLKKAREAAVRIESEARLRLTLR